MTLTVGVRAVGGRPLLVVVATEALYAVGSYYVLSNKPIPNSNACRQDERWVPTPKAFTHARAAIETAFTGASLDLAQYTM